MSVQVTIAPASSNTKQAVKKSISKTEQKKIDQLAKIAKLKAEQPRAVQTHNTIETVRIQPTPVDVDKLLIPGRSIIEAMILAPFYIHKAPTRSFNSVDVSNEVAVLLNDDFAKIEHVPGLKTMLYPHQQTAVNAMLEIERQRNFTQEIAATKAVYKIAYNVAVLSEPVGSGKTIDVLALVCLNKRPRAVPDIMQLGTAHTSTSIGYVRRYFEKFLKPTIIFVGSSVMKQWGRAITTFTSLTHFAVNSVIELKLLFEMISNKMVNKYDIILVKNGKITVPIELPDGIPLEPKNEGGTPYIYNLIANLREFCWSRVVIDDFDTIKLPHNAGIVSGIFTWYISSTRKSMENRATSTKFQLASEILQNYDYGCANIMRNHFLFRTLNIRNSPEYLENTTKIPNPKFHVAIFKNQDNRYIKLISSIGDDEVNRITEMLNGDAIGAAAEAAGIKTDSVAKIFEKILGNKYELYRFSSEVVEFIGYQEGKKEERRPIAENPDPEDKYGKKDLLEFREIEYKYPGVNTLLKETDEEYKEVKKQNGTAIQRVKDNIKNGECYTCKMDLADSADVIIVKCCSATFCGKCGILSQNIADRYNRLSGRCGNCRTALTIKDLIYIGEGFNLNNIADENIEESDEQPAELADVKTVKPVNPAKPRTKFTAIIDIINGVDLPEDKRVDMYIPNMMKGSHYMKESKTRKVLIFANFDETLTKVIKELTDEKIKFWRLQGGIGEIDRTAAEFTNCNETCALVINSTRHCSGLNLQTATDLIFAHKIIDHAIESQVAGRGHRLGRNTPLNVWFLVYENEYEMLSHTHSTRVMTAAELKEEKDREDGKVIINEDTDDEKEPPKAKRSMKKAPPSYPSDPRATCNFTPSFNDDASDAGDKVEPEINNSDELNEIINQIRDTQLNQSVDAKQNEAELRIYQQMKNINDKLNDIAENDPLAKQMRKKLTEQYFDLARQIEGEYEEPEPEIDNSDDELSESKNNGIDEKKQSNLQLADLKKQINDLEHQMRNIVGNDENARKLRKKLRLQYVKLMTQMRVLKNNENGVYDPHGLNSDEE